MTITSKEHKIYMYLGRNEEILYIGITKDLRTRDKAHSASKPWYDDEVESFKLLGRFDKRNEAEEFERQQIQLNRPKYNITYNNDKEELESKGLKRAKPSRKKRYSDYVEKPIFVSLDEIDDSSFDNCRRWEYEQAIIEISGSVLTTTHREILDNIFSSFECKSKDSSVNYIFSLEELKTILEKDSFFVRNGLEKSKADTVWFNSVLTDLMSALFIVREKETKTRIEGHKAINEFGTGTLETLDGSKQYYVIGFNKEYLKNIEPILATAPKKLM